MLLIPPTCTLSTPAQQQILRRLAQIDTSNTHNWAIEASPVDKSCAGRSAALPAAADLIRSWLLQSLLYQLPRISRSLKIILINNNCVIFGHEAAGSVDTQVVKSDTPDQLRPWNRKTRTGEQCYQE